MVNSVSDRSPQQRVAASLGRERVAAGMSQAELARRANVAKSTLSQLESGIGNPSLETLWALSTALGIPFSRLVDPPSRRVEVIRAGEGPGIASGDADYIATLLASSPPNARRDIYAIRAEPGSVRASVPHAPGVVEHLILGTGRARAGPTDAPVELGPGDYISYPGDEDHVFEALTPGTVAVLITEHV